MSVINRMLRDLDERQAGSAGMPPLHAEIRSVNEVSPVRWHLWAAAGVCALTIVAAGAWFAGRYTKKSAELPDVVQQAQLPLKLTSQLSFPARLVTSEEAPAVPQDPVSRSDTQIARADAAVAKVTEEVRPAAGSEKAVETPSAVVSVPAASSQPAASEGRDAAPKAAMPSVPKSVPASDPAPARAAASAPPAAEMQSVPMPVKQVRELSSRERAENEYRRAATLIQQARLPEAITALEQALSIDARHAGARQLLVGALLDTKRTDDALRAAQEGLALDSSQTGLAMILARLQVDRGDLPGAIETLQRSLPAGAERADYQSFIAALMQRAGRHKEAVAHYLVAVRKSPQNGVWWMGLGISLQAETRNAEAQEAFTRAKSSGSLSGELQAFVEQRLAQLQR